MPTARVRMATASPPRHRASERAAKRNSDDIFGMWDRVASAFRRKFPWGLPDLYRGEVPGRDLSQGSRPVERAGVEEDALPWRIRVGHRNRREQRPRVGMLRRREELRGLGHFDDAPEVHYRDAAADVFDQP